MARGRAQAREAVPGEDRQSGIPQGRGQEGESISRKAVL